MVEPIREELLAGASSRCRSGRKRLGARPTVTGNYRGTAVEQYLRPKARLECVVGPEQAQTVVDTVSKHGGDRYFVFVSAVDAAAPVDTVNLEPATQEA